MVVQPEIFYGIGAFVLLAALAYGVYRSRGRSRRQQAVTDEATRELYQQPQGYDAERQAELRRAAERP